MSDQTDPSASGGAARRLTGLLSRVRGELPALGVLTLAVVIVHWSGIKPGHTFLAVDLVTHILPWRDGTPPPLQNSLISDPLYQFFPFLTAQLDALKQGRWLFWSPQIYLGHPTLADPLFQTFYPLFLPPAWLFGVARGYAIGLVLHLLLAGGLTYGLFRTLQLSRPGALLGALTYALSGYLLTWLEFGFWTSTLAWLPGILWAFVCAGRRRSFFLAAVAGLLSGVAFLAGQLQFALGYLVALTLIAAFQTLESRRSEGRFSLYPMLLLAIAAGCGLLVAGMQLLPFAEFLPLSRRVADGGQLDPLPPGQLITLIVPDFFGTPVTQSYWGWFNYNEGTIYAGVVVLFLALAALLARPRGRTLYLALAVVGLLYFAVGGPGVEMLARLPGLRYLSLHRSVCFLPLLLGLMAAGAVDQPVLPLRAQIGAILLIGGAVAGALIGYPDALTIHREQLVPALMRMSGLLLLCVLLTVYARMAPGHRQGVRFAFVALVFLDVLLFGRAYNPTGPVDALFPPTPAVEYLQQNADERRVVPLQRNNDLTMVPNITMQSGLMEPGGYSSLVTRRLHDLVTADDPEVGWFWFDRSHNMLPFSEPSDGLLDLLATRYVISPEPWAEPPLVAEVEPGPCVSQTEELTAHSPLTGEFQVTKSAINRIDIPFRPDSAGNSAPGVLELRMWRIDDDAERLMLEEIIDGQDVVDRSTQTRYFVPEVEGAGRRYRWELLAGSENAAEVRVCADHAGAPEIAVYGLPFAEIFEDDRVYIKERFGALSRARVVYAAEVITQDDAAVQRLLDPAFDRRNLAVTAQETGLPQTPPLPGHAATILGATEQSVQIEANAEAPGLLVLADLYYPGWTATVDGEPVPILRVNHVARGVRLEPGRHLVDFRFQPATLRLGALSLALGLLMLPLMWGIDRRRRSKSSRSE